MLADSRTTPTDTLRESYDSFPYLGWPIHATHPATIASMAALYGVTSPPLAGCRVLELGCGTGGNLLPMAFSLPGSTLVGIDLSPTQVAMGARIVAALDLTQVRLEAMDLRDVGEDFGTFDFIICHGVYSWVPPEVQDTILRICSRNLAPGGLAYVSYNAYPGWRLREMVRDMLMFHDDVTLATGERLARARALAGWLARSVPQGHELYEPLLRAEAATLSEQTDHHLLHEQLEQFNMPLYFSEFARRAAAAGLRFVAEAVVNPTATAISESARADIEAWSADRIQREQYEDFLTNRMFRRTVLTHADRPVLDRPSHGALRSMHLLGHVERLAVEGTDPTVRGFRAPDGDISLTTNNPLVIAALELLADTTAPAMAFTDLWARVRERLLASEHEEAPRLAAEGEEVLARTILRFVLARLVDPILLPAVAAGPRPVASPLARHEAARGIPICNLHHTLVELDEVGRFILGRLDGTADHDAVVAAVREAVSRGELSLDALPEELRDDLSAAVRHALTRLSRMALLIA